MPLKIWLPAIRALSGGDVYVRRLAAALSKAGAEPIVEWLPHNYQYFPQLLRRHRKPTGADLVDANSWVAFSFRRPDLPLVATALHCVYKRGYPRWKSLPQAIYHDYLVGGFERRSFCEADATIAISQSTHDEVLEDFSPRHIQTIPLWVDVERYTPTNAPMATTSRQSRILIVGNMSRRKGGDLIAPFCNALGQDFEVTVVAGLRGETPAVSPRGASLGFLKGLSESELVGQYQKTDIVVSLSRHEGFGYTALEGMACGKPVVAFRVSGLKDVIEDGGTGLLVDVDDVAAMARACQALRADPTRAKELGAHGRERSVRHFSESAAAAAHLELYQSLLDTRQ
ncbi:MAG TPA: glycosyltransferase family 4 protein [Frateuria sp.]|uniref:glycosyltransferase family 4 protein n=1 Tax=Frateuria sp. TaxID=2211372 RepID=UPI002D7EEFBD|nr:glycosyltransferase family 4 protein [Frateuria sp.]HET6807308.1 glycosyltransferase family 4 protein [Frateuria sp.]